MRIICVILFSLALTNAQKWNISLSKSDFKIHKDDVIKVPFTVNNINLEVDKIIPSVIATSSNVKIANASTPLLLNSAIENTNFYDGSVNISGVFIGKAEILITIKNDNALRKITVVVTRPERLIDKLFTSSVITLVAILYVNFGCAMDWKGSRKTMKKPIGPLIGVFCQFILMPLLSFGVGHVLFPDNPEMQLGIFFTGISPSGGASNIWTALLGGNLPLSIAMTTISTLASFGTIPLWVFTLGKIIFDKGNFDIPYAKIAMIATGLIIPLAVGYFIQRKMPRLSRIMVRIMKPFSVILILFIVIFAIITNLYLLELFSWRIVLAGMGLPWLGFICGFIIMSIFRQPRGDIRAIAIETGIQNTGIAIFLLQLSLKQPAADLTTVMPVSCAIMTPIPLMILWLIKIVFDKRKKKDESSMEKMQLDVNTPVITPSNISTITT